MESKRAILFFGGFDPTNGAGIVADSIVGSQIGVKTFSVITAITVQDDRGVYGYSTIDISVIKEQLDRLGRFDIGAIKAGMLVNSEYFDILIEFSSKKEIPVFLDPLLYSKNDFPLYDESHYREDFLKYSDKVFLIAPNKREAELLSGVEIKDRFSMIKACEVLLNKGFKYVYLKSGHLDVSYDLLCNHKSCVEIRGEKIKGRSLHGSGCIFLSALTSFFVSGLDIQEAAQEAKQFIENKIKNSFFIREGGFFYAF